MAVGSVAALLVGLLRLARATWRVDAGDKARIDALLSDGQPTIAAFWHGQMVPLLALLQDHPAIVVSSPGFRGGVIGRIAQAFGHRSLQMEGGAAAMALCRALRDGRAQIALAVDGPLGPPLRAKPGAVFLSASTHARILPIAVAVRPAVALRRWDRLIIPLPFASVSLRSGPLLRFTKADLGDLDGAAAGLSGRLADLCDG